MALEAKLNGLVPQLEQGQGNLGRKTVRTLLALSGVACHLCGMRLPESREGCREASRVLLVVVSRVYDCRRGVCKLLTYEEL